MTDSDARGEGVVLDDLLREAAADQAGALWRLTGAERQLDANVVRLRAGASVADHVEPELDVLVLGIAGEGTLRCGDTTHALRPGALRLLPRGATRAVAAGPEGVVYLTVHRRRPGLAIRPRP
ncbi:cupin domain-containing protein [Kitasatospora sp. NPDC127111]|uniref:cupin domain-containing protein n=1 Tax=Kitasatospora sp. NPDC127111 TaxID=3345363 RepID=UPI003624CBA6